MFWTLTGLAIPQTLIYQPCTTRHVFPAWNTAAPIQEVVALYFAWSHHPPFPSPRTWGSTRTSLSSESCAETSPLPAERCAGSAGLLSAVFFHQRPRRRDVRSGSLPGWAPSWKFSPIKLKWIIFKWHFHPVQERSVSQHQRAFASVCFAPAPWCTSTSKVLPSTSCTYARRASQWNCTPQLHEAGPGEIFLLPYFPPSQPAYCEFLKLSPKDCIRQAKICSSLQRNKSIVRATVS